MDCIASFAEDSEINLPNITVTIKSLVDDKDIGMLALICDKAYITSAVNDVEKYRRFLDCVIKTGTISSGSDSYGYVSSLTGNIYQLSKKGLTRINSGYLSLTNGTYQGHCFNIASPGIREAKIYNSSLIIGGAPDPLTVTAGNRYKLYETCLEHNKRNDSNEGFVIICEKVLRDIKEQNQEEGRQLLKTIRCVKGKNYSAQQIIKIVFYAIVQPTYQGSNYIIKNSVILNQFISNPKKEMSLCLEHKKYDKEQITKDIEFIIDTSMENPYSESQASNVDKKILLANPKTILANLLVDKYVKNPSLCYVDFLSYLLYNSSGKYNSIDFMYDDEQCGITKNKDVIDLDTDNMIVQAFINSGFCGVSVDL